MSITPHITRKLKAVTIRKIVRDAEAEADRYESEVRLRIPPCMHCGARGGEVHALECDSLEDDESP